MKTLRLGFQLLILVSALLFFASCDQKERSGRQRKGDVSGVPVSGASDNSVGGDSIQGHLAGTNFSGGGSGSKGKVFESYIVKHRELPAYKEHILPAFQQLTENSIDILKQMDGAVFEPVSSFKTWYIAPVELKAFSKESLGLYFIEGEVDPVAAQTEAEIWINKTAFEKMTPKQQADLILHEIVMEEFLRKYLSPKQICKLTQLTFSSEANRTVSQDTDKLKPARCHEQEIELANRILPAEAFKALDDKDNESIRVITGWLLSPPYGANVLDLRDIMIVHEFDSRFWNSRKFTYPEEDSEDIQSLEVSSDEIALALEKIQVIGYGMNFCWDTSEHQMYECRPQVEEQSFQYGASGLQLEVPSLYFEIETKTSEYDFHLPIYPNTIIARQHSTELSSMSNGMFNMVTMPVTVRREVPFQIHTPVLVFSNSAATDSVALTLEYVILIPATVIKIDQESESSRCRLASNPEGKGRVEPIILSRTDREPDISIVGWSNIAFDEMFCVFESSMTQN